MKDEKISLLALVKNSQEKNIVAFLKRNATAYEQNVWHVIFTNATVLADNVKSRKEVEGRS